jgi:hypothetical protein
MPRRSRLAVAALVVLALSGQAAPTTAAAPRNDVGEIRAVDAQAASIILKKSTGDLAELRVGGVAKIILDGKPSKLDALKPGLKVVRFEAAADGSVRSLHVRSEPVRFRVAVTGDGECRVMVGRSIPEMDGRPADGMVPVTTWYSAKPSPDSVDPKCGSLVGQFADPKRRGGTVVCPRAFRFPCVVTGDITELRDARLGVQIISSGVNLVLGITTDDGLTKSANLRVTCSSRAPGAEGAYNQNPMTIEHRIVLDKPEELRFHLPFTEALRGQLMTLDAVLDAVKREGASPSAVINRVCIAGRNESTLGMRLGVRQRKLVVERVDPSGLVSRHG